MLHRTFIVEICLAVQLLAWAIPAYAQIALRCSIDSIHIKADNDLQRYEPMPFTLTVHVQNVGNQITDTVYATIIVPPDLQLHGADRPDQNTKVVAPAYIYPNASGNVSWTLFHPITLSRQFYTVRVNVKTKRADSCSCEMVVVIPPMDAPSVRASCVAPSELKFVDSLDSYDPNPFPVTLTVINAGKMTADSVTAFFYLPDGVALDPPDQSLVHHFGSLEAWRTGLPYPSHTWTVRWPSRLRYNAVAAFKWAVGGIGHESERPTDTVYATCETDVPQLHPMLDVKCGNGHSYTCGGGCDTLIWNSDLNDYSPNPVFVRLRATNVGHIPAGVTSMVCYYPNDGIALDSSIPGNTMTRELQRTLEPGDSVIEYWWFRVQPRIDERVLQIQLILFDDEGNPCIHERHIIISGIKMCLGYRDHNSTSVVDYDSTLQWYTDRRITLSHGLYNCGDWTYTNSWIELKLFDPEGYLAYDSAYLNPQRHIADKLTPGDTLYGTWHLRLAKPNTTGVVQIIAYEFRFGTDGSSIDEQDGHYLLIEPAIVTGIDAPPGAPGFSLSQNYPNPFNPATEIAYSIPSTMHVKLAVYDPLGREIAVPVRGLKDAGQHRTTFDATNLPPGLYIYRLETAHGRLTRKMVLAK